MKWFVESAVEPIGPWQYFFLMAMSMVTGAVYIWPQALMSAAGPESDWAVIGSIGLGLVMTTLGMIWIHVSPPGILVDRLQYAWGPLRWPILTVHALLCLLLDTAVLTLFTQMLATTFYPITPLWVMKLLIVGEAVWFASRSLSTLTRNIQLWLPLFAGMFFVLSGMALAHSPQGWALTPAPLTAVGPVGRGVLATWFLWKQNEVASTAVHFVRPQNMTLMRRLTLGAVAFQGAVVTTVYLITVGTLGPQAVSLLRWPLVYVLGNLSAHSFYLSRPGLLILLIWTGSMVFYLAGNVFCMGVNFSRLLTGSYQSSPPVILVVGLAIALSSLGIATPTEATHWVLDLFNPIDLSYSVGIISLSILLSLVLSRIRRHRPDKAHLTEGP